MQSGVRGEAEIIVPERNDLAQSGPQFDRGLDDVLFRNAASPRSGLVELKEPAGFEQFLQVVPSFEGSVLSPAKGSEHALYGQPTAVHC